MTFHIRHCSRYTTYHLANSFLKNSSETVLLLLLFLYVKIKASRTEFTCEKLYSMKVSAQDSTHSLNLCSLQPSISLCKKPDQYVDDR